METSCELVIEAQPDDVWRHASDITVPARFSPELRSVRWLEPGVKFEGHNENAVLGRWRTIATIIECDEPRAFAWTVADPDGRFGEVTGEPMATWRFDLERTPRGAILTHAVRIGPARSGLSLAVDRFPDKEEALVRHRLADLRAGMLETLRGIKALAES